MSFVRLNEIRKKYVPTPALVLFVTAVFAAAVHIVSEFSEPFSDFVNRYVSSLVRGIPALVTSVIPFSLAETFILLIPVILITVVYACNRAVNRSITAGIRFVVSAVSVLALVYSVFVFSTVVAYNGTSLASKLGLEEKTVSVSELEYAAQYVISEMNTEIEKIDFVVGENSVMPYSIGEMNAHLMKAYQKAADKYSFIPRLVSRVKPIALSDAMTYTHISGIYTYFTGESNVNVNFPDYTMPYTAAHELAHQRGILPEDEANFVAYLVCMESDEPYIRYSALLNMYQYLNSALYTADIRAFARTYGSLAPQAQGELSAYSSFFEKYRDNRAAGISSAVNDSYLKLQGEADGEKSYGMVVDLAVAYIMSLDTN